MGVGLPTKREHAPESRLRGYHLFRILGFEVKLDLSWLLLALLITWTLAAGLFPASYPGLPHQIYWWMGVAGALGILFSIVFHELSHSLVARHYGLPMRGITLFIFGGVAEMEEEPVSPKVEFLMAVAGPLASVFLGGLFLLLEWVIVNQEWPVALVGISHYLFMLNIIVAIFNLVPAFPLDGGRMLRAALWHWRNNLRSATRIASEMGSGFGLVLMILGGLAFIQGNFIGGMWWLLIGAFLRSAAKASYRQHLVHEMLSDKTVREFMNSNPVTLPPNATLAQILDDYIYKYHFKLFPVVENGKLTGCVDIHNIKQIPREQWAEKTVREVVMPCDADNTVSPQMNAAKLVSKMVKPGGTGRYMVAENGRLLGMVSLKDLREFIDLKLEIESTQG
jgi:Zn-dependent protease/predicted transcriptional regulator